MPFVTPHLEIFHCTHHSVIPKSDLYFTFCSTLNAVALGNGMNPSTPLMGVKLMYVSALPNI